MEHTQQNLKKAKIKNILVGGTNLPQEGMSFIEMALSFSPQGFAQSHIGERCVVVVHPSLGQRLMKQGWEVSLPDMGLSKTLRTKAQNHFERGQFLLEVDSFLPQKSVVVVHSFLGQRLIRQWWEEHSSLDSWLQIYFVTKSLFHSTLSYEINPKESIL